MSLTRFQSTPSAAPNVAAPKLHVVTFGCQMNKYDSLLVEGRFQERGYATTDDPAAADVILFNTCSVREHAEERAWSWLGELKRAKESRPELVIGVMGCMAQRVGDEILRRAGHVDVVCGTRQLHHMAELVSEVRERRRDPERWRARDMRLVATGMDDDVAVDRSAEEYRGGLHAWLAVMRGCDLACAFCIVPTTRGKVRSRPIADLVAEARWMVERGAKAITLLGQTVNSYGEDFAPAIEGAPPGRGRQGRPALADLLYALQELDGLVRIRLVTLHPAYATRELARAIAECDKVERFLPLPAQSGSDRILRAMRRGYTTDLYRRRLDTLRNEVPDLELASDWIVGFPGETDEDFEASRRFLAEVGFAVNYVFKYDPRPGTAAAERCADDVPAEVKKERNRLLLEASEQSGLRRLSAQVGREVQVFSEEESERRAGLLHGRSLQGLPVSFEGAPELLGRVVPVRIERASAFGLGGSVACG